MAGVPFIAFWDFIRWSFESLADRVWPRRRHDGEDWHPSDSWRERLAGTSMENAGACLYICGEWSEYVGTIGVPQWNSLIRPCYGCNASIRTMCDTSLVHRAEGLGWRVNGDLDYAAACARCEIIVTLSDRTRALVVGRLRFDRRQDGSHGLALAGAVPELGLFPDDRLEPSPSLPDVSFLREVDLSHDKTIRVVFWRLANESLTKHRNPIFDERLGISAKRSVTVDTLHCLYLGVFKSWCSVVIWVLINRCCYARVGTEAENLASSIMVMRHTLNVWYVNRAKMRRDETRTRLADLIPKMVGTNNDPKLKVKAAECWGIMLFLINELRRLEHRAGPDWAALLQAGEALVQMVDIWQNCGINISMDAQRAAFGHYNRHMILMAVFDIFVPKHHMVYHLLSNMSYHGNPKEYDTWLSEALNKVLKGACRGASQATFEQTVLVRMHHLLRQ